MIWPGSHSRRHGASSPIARKSSTPSARSRRDRVADLNAQLATITRTAESATDRVVDLEARLAETVEARDEASTRGVAAREQLARAVADTEQLRTQAASIGDELAGETQAALDVAKSEAKPPASEGWSLARQDAMSARQAARERADLPVSSRRSGSRRARPVDLGGGGRVHEPGVTGQVQEPEKPAPTPRSTAAIASPRSAPGVGRRPVRGCAAPVEEAGQEVDHEFRTVESIWRPFAQGWWSGGGAEASLVREIARSSRRPTTPSPRRPSPRSRRKSRCCGTAMAALTDLATDSDDLTPRRRRDPVPHPAI